MEEAKKRVEDDQISGEKLNRMKKRKNKKQKEVTFEPKNTFINASESASENPVHNVLIQVESDLKNIEAQEIQDIDVDDDCLLNGFMDGFEEDTDDKDYLSSKHQNIFSQVDAGTMFKIGAVCIVALSAAVFIRKLHS